MKKYNVILQTRDFEINLFWKRSLFFWGFIASAFAGYVVLGENMYTPKENNYNQLGHFLVTLFGFICSCAWVLVNLGGKCWQENWENRLYEAEGDITGLLFEKRHKDNKDWMSFSPSKITIFLSGVTALIWFILLLGFSMEFECNNDRICTSTIDSVKLACIGLLSLFIAVFMLCSLRSKIQKEE